MNLKKIHIKERLHIFEWNKKTLIEDKPVDLKHSMMDIGAAVPGFYTALQSLVKDVCDICEFQDNYHEGMKIVAVTFAYNDETWGAMISAIKSVKNSNAPFNIHTPFKWAAAKDPSEESGCLSKGCIKRLELLKEYAQGYIDGTRAQGNLPFKEEGNEKQSRDPNYRVSKAGASKN